MASASVVILKQNDRRPAVTATFQDANNAAINLSGATIVFQMASWDGVAKINAAASLISASTGQVEYQWLVSDSNQAGAYRAEFEATFADGRRLTAPNDGYISVYVVRELA